MDKIEECENLLSEWKAEKAKAERMGWLYQKSALDHKISGLISALRIFKQPSNTQMHVDTKPCSFCKRLKKTYLWNFCKVCGRALSQ